MKDCKPLENCLCCGSDNLRVILDLGQQSPVNNYAVSQKFPLMLNVCLNCSHGQLSHSVNPSVLFSDYPYMSGVSETMRQYYKSFAQATIEAYPEAKTVLEIACNDGAQLDEFKNLGLETFGIDPAANLLPISTERGHKVDCSFFPTDKSLSTFDNGPYDLIVAQNVVAHTPDPYNFLLACKDLMHKDSLLIIQTSQAKMIDNHQFDSIYAEHISFFNNRSISKLLIRCDLVLVEQKFIPTIHGGSDLFVLKKMPEISIQDYSDFQNRCYRFAREFKNKVDEIQKTSEVICYGAAAKMINLIRFTGIEPNAIIDDTPTKQGKLIDGKYPICPSSDLEVAQRGSTIIPVWNFYQEIKDKVESKYPGKFKFLKYIPSIE